MELEEPFRDHHICADQAPTAGVDSYVAPSHQMLMRGKNLQQCRHLETLEQDCRKTPSCFELEGMLYYSTLVKLELIRQVSFKCNNVKETQTIISPTRQGKNILHLASLFYPCAVFWGMPQLGHGRWMLPPLHCLGKFPL